MRSDTLIVMIGRSLTVVVAWLAVLAIGPRAGTVPAGAGRAIEQVSGAELRAHVEQLASDGFAGRALGQDGNRRAEAYLAAALERSGVEPAAPGYLQDLELHTASLAGTPRLEVSAASGPIAAFEGTADFYPLPVSGSRDVSAPVVFAGHGLSAPSWRHDDYRALDASGALVLTLEGAPAWLKDTPGLSDDDKVDAFSLGRKIADAKRHGAVGLIVIREHLDDAAVVWPPPGSAADRPLVPGGDPAFAVAALAARSAAPIRQALEQGEALTARLSPALALEPVGAHNVIGMVEGRTEAGLVVVGAHLDHDGVGEDGRVFNGADDNASGTAAVLAIAAAFARAAADGARPERAVVFALWNGEEEGLFGAERYASTPVPARPVVANINLDMVGRAEDIPAGDSRFSGFRPTRARANANALHLIGYSVAPDLARIVDRANESVRLSLKREYDRGAQSLLRRSDHWAFLKRGIPAIFLTTGLHPDYHTPDDDADRLDYAKLERIAELAARVAWMTADGEAPRLAR